MTLDRMFRVLPLATALVVATLLSQIGFAQSGDAGTDQPQADARTAIISVVQAYHSALIAQDKDGALALLAPDVMVLESGHIETAEEYVAHHLEADMEFSGATSGGHDYMLKVVAPDMASYQDFLSEYLRVIEIS